MTIQRNNSDIFFRVRVFNYHCDYGTLRLLTIWIGPLGITITL